MHGIHFKVNKHRGLVLVAALVAISAAREVYAEAFHSERGANKCLIALR